MLLYLVNFVFQFFLQSFFLVKIKLDQRETKFKSNEFSVIFSVRLEVYLLKFSFYLINFWVSVEVIFFSFKSKLGNCMDTVAVQQHKIAGAIV